MSCLQKLEQCYSIQNHHVFHAEQTWNLSLSIEEATYVQEVQAQLEKDRV